MRTVAVIALTLAAGAAVVIGAAQPPPHMPARGQAASGTIPGACPNAGTVAAKSARALVAKTRTVSTPGSHGGSRPQQLVPLSTEVVDTTVAVGGALRVEVLVDARTPTGITVAVPEVLIVTCAAGCDVVSGAAR